MNRPAIAMPSGAAPPKWPDQLAQLHATARANAPDLPLVLSGACGGGPEGLAALDPVADDNVIWSFHSYFPFLFTRHGAKWTGSLATVLPHLPYPPTLLTRQTALELARDASRFAAAQNIDTDPPATEANLINSFSDYRAHEDGRVSEAAQIAADWADAHQIAHSRLLLGEFGAMQPPDDTAQDQASRLRFLRAKSLSAQSLGIGWAV